MAKAIAIAKVEAFRKVLSIMVVSCFLYIVNLMRLTGHIHIYAEF